MARPVPFDSNLQELASGALAFVDPATRKATLLACDWLVRVRSDNPEPDSPADLWIEVECGNKVRRHPDHPNDGTLCDAGHDRLPVEIAWQDERILAEERRAEERHEHRIGLWS